jgi:hypothetical protein
MGILQAAQAGTRYCLADTAAPRSDRAHRGAITGAEPHGARTTANQEQVRLQFNQFLTNGRGYQAQIVSRFHPGMTPRMHWRAGVETGPREIESAVAL